MGDTLDRHSSRCSHCNHQTETGTAEGLKLDCSNSNTSILYTLVQLCLLPFSCCFNKQKTDIQRTSPCVPCKNEQLTPKSKQPIQMEFVPLPWMQHEAESNNDSNQQQHWIFRTGWTPRPEQLEKMWCSNCGAYARKDLDRCIYCGIELIDG
ncbi:unnamed protein product [Rhizopus microsporus]|uniref:Uncharacterized protein n=1 Tax=Rhizopus microsporus TaxID=58291 RepID=A0A1X0S8B8_RHIZD|nr:hypothetical protein BCV71DRAFT_233064 [Rhizopus microsporus]